MTVMKQTPILVVGTSADNGQTILAGATVTVIANGTSTVLSTAAAVAIATLGGTGASPSWCVAQVLFVGDVLPAIGTGLNPAGGYYS